MGNKVVINSEYGGFNLSEEAWEELSKLKGSLEEDFILSRHDKDLVSVVEKLGERANGCCAELEIVEIDSDKYYIEEYDGKETIYTPDTICWEIIEE